MLLLVPGRSDLLWIVAQLFGRWYAVMRRTSRSREWSGIRCHAWMPISWVWLMHTAGSSDGHWRVRAAVLLRTPSRSVRCIAVARWGVGGCPCVSSHSHREVVGRITLRWYRVGRNRDALVACRTFWWSVWKYTAELRRLLLLKRPRTHCCWR